jgi:hypothetical protein
MQIRTFLGFNMTNQLDIYIQDKLANGDIEAPRANIYSSSTSSTIVSSTLLQLDGSASGSVSNGISAQNLSQKSDAISLSSGRTGRISDKLTKPWTLFSSGNKKSTKDVFVYVIDNLESGL